MKNLLSILVALLISFQLNGQSCSDHNWTPDVTLDYTLTSELVLVDKSVLITDGFLNESKLVLNNCIVKVENRIRFTDNATFEIYESVFTPCNGTDWLGFRFDNGFTNEHFATYKIRNSEFYNFAELIHINILDQSVFQFTNNIAFTNDTYSHIFHFVNPGNDSEFKFYGNKLESPLVIIKLESSEEYNGVWNVGDELYNPNIFKCSEGSALFGNNGNINIENSIFKDSKYGVYLNRAKVKIDNCQFNNNEYGILEHFNGNGTSEVLNSSFLNNEQGIHLVNNTAMVVNNTSFSSNDIGIKVSLSNATEGGLSVFESNFYNDIDIHATGAYMDPIVLQENVFGGSNYGLFFDGESYYRTRNNDFINSYLGSFIYSNGYEDNLLEENTISGSIGIHTQGENNDFKFLDNCFQTYSEDINSIGSLSQFIGDDITGAGNCFTGANAIDINHEGTLFDYFLPPSEENTCHEPMNDSDYGIMDADGLDFKDCGSGYQPLSDQPYCYVSSNPNCSEVTAALNYVQQEILSVQNDPNLTEYVKSIMISRLRRCERYLSILKMRKCLITTTPSNPLEGGGGFAMQAKYLSILIVNELYTEAQNLIVTLTASSTEESDYLFTQSINLRKHQEGSAFQLSNGEYNQLISIGQKSNPLSAYARGLLTKLTGEILYPSVVLADNVHPRSVDKSSNAQISLMPNPTNHFLKIDVGDSRLEFTFELIDVNGLSHVKGKERGSMNIDMSNIPSGIYVTSIQTVDGYKEIHKIVKI